MNISRWNGKIWKILPFCSDPSRTFRSGYRIPLYVTSKLSLLSSPHYITLHIKILNFIGIILWKTKFGTDLFFFFHWENHINSIFLNINVWSNHSRKREAFSTMIKLSRQTKNLIVKQGAAFFRTKFALAFAHLPKLSERCSF